MELDLSIIKDSYFRSIMFSHKYMDRCELTNNEYKDNSILCKRLKGIYYIGSHHCYGSICYHPDNHHLFKYAEAYKEFNIQMVSTHNL